MHNFLHQCPIIPNKVDNLIQHDSKMAISTSNIFHILLKVAERVPPLFNVLPKMDLKYTKFKKT